MEVAGFKKTEAGLIPEDWAVCYLPDILRFRSGKAHEQYITDDGDHICVNSKFISTDGKVRKYASANFCPAKTGDILMVMSDLPNGKALAKAFLVQGKQNYAVNQRVCALTPYKDESKYLYYVLNRNPYFLKFDDGVSQTHLLNPVFSKCVLPVPPTKVEQQAIAEALSDMDATIEALEQLITKKRYIKQGTMQELLIGKRRLPGFSGVWVEHTLKEYLDYEQPTKYIVKSNEYTDVGDIAVLTANKSFILGYTSEEEGVFTDLPVIIFDDFTTDKKLVDFPFKVKSSALKILKLKNHKADLNFLFYIMQITKLLYSDHKRYWISEYQNIKIPMPDFIEQQAISKVLSDMDAELETLESKLTKARYLKQGMMQQLLTGRIRLK